MLKFSEKLRSGDIGPSAKRFVLCYCVFDSLHRASWGSPAVIDFILLNPDWTKFR
jgi:hypothetical protein